MSEIQTIVIPLIIGLTCMFAGFKFREKNKRLISNGIEVEGIIFSQEESSDGDIENRSAYPIIRFVTKEGLWITEKTDLAIPVSILNKDKSVKVFYNPDNPKDFVYKTSLPLSWVEYLFIVVGILMLLYGAWNAYNFLTQHETTSYIQGIRSAA